MAQIDITKERKGMFTHALAGAEPCDEIVYHVGQYAAGAHKADAFSASEAGLCLIYQRRVGGGMFAYVAKKPKK